MLKDWCQLKNQLKMLQRQLQCLPLLCWMIIRQRCSLTVCGSAGTGQQGCVYFLEVIFCCLPRLFIFSLFVSPSSCTVITCTPFICLSPVWLSLPWCLNRDPQAFGVLLLKRCQNAANGAHLTQFLSSTNCNSEGGEKRFYTLSFSEKKTLHFAFCFMHQMQSGSFQARSHCYF